MLGSVAEHHHPYLQRFTEKKLPLFILLGEE